MSESRSTSLVVVQDHNKDDSYRERYIDAEFAAIRREMAAFKELVNSQRHDDKENISTALQASDKAVNKAEEAYEKRLEGLNELRGTVSDRISAIEGRLQGIVVVASIISVAVAVYTIVIK